MSRLLGLLKGDRKDKRERRVSKAVIQINQSVKRSDRFAVVCFLSFQAGEVRSRTERKECHNPLFVTADDEMNVCTISP